MADPDPTDVPPHRHFIVAPTGELVQVGPRVCDDPDLQDAFNQFHHNVHVDAPGLHDHAAAGITVRECAFAP